MACRLALIRRMQRTGVNRSRVSAICDFARQRFMLSSALEFVTLIPAYAVAFKRLKTS